MSDACRVKIPAFEVSILQTLLEDSFVFSCLIRPTAFLLNISNSFMNKNVWLKGKQLKIPSFTYMHKYNLFVLSSAL